MKRTLLISVLLAIALAACGKQQESAPAGAVAQPAPANSSAGVATPSATAEPVKEGKR
jgi:nitrous oxide reductase accessory protein NosL